MLCDDLDRWDEVGGGGREIQEGGFVQTHTHTHTHTHKADSHRCIAETNTNL